MMRRSEQSSPVPILNPIYHSTDLSHNFCLSLQVPLEELWSSVFPLEAIFILNHTCALFLNL